MVGQFVSLNRQNHHISLMKKNGSLFKPCFGDFGSFSSEF